MRCAPPDRVSPAALAVPGASGDPGRARLVLRRLAHPASKLGAEAAFLPLYLLVCSRQDCTLRTPATDPMHLSSTAGAYQHQCLPIRTLALCLVAQAGGARPNGEHWSVCLQATQAAPSVSACGIVTDPLASMLLVLVRRCAPRALALGAVAQCHASPARHAAASSASACLRVLADL